MVLLLGLLVFSLIGGTLPAVAATGPPTSHDRRLVKVSRPVAKPGPAGPMAAFGSRVRGFSQRALDDVSFALLRFAGRYLRIAKRPPDDGLASDLNAQRFNFTLLAAIRSYGRDGMTQLRLQGFRFMRPQAVRDKLLRVDGDVALMTTTDRYRQQLVYVMTNEKGRLLGVQLDPAVYTPYPLSPIFEVNPRRFAVPGGKPVVAYRALGNRYVGQIEAPVSGG